MIKKVHKNTNLTKLIFLLILSVLVTSCNLIDSFQVLNNSSIQENLEILTSNNANGRLSGTSGNELVGEYIEDKFKAMGLDTYEDSYLFQYTHKGWKPLEEDYKMTIKFSDGEVLQCKYGEDFLENDMRNIDLTAELALNYKDEDIHNKVVLLENPNDILEEGVKVAKVILRPEPSFERHVPKFEDEGIRIVQISNRLNKLMREKKVDEIEIDFKVNAVTEEFHQNNIVGVIPGENRKNAIVITAHYDHVGNNGEMIWRGAIDNSTGTVALIDIAEKLKSYSQEEILKQDIVFCAFNGEESGFQGSIPFVKDIKEKYDNLYNINIDCVGIKDGGRLLVDGEEEGSNELLELMNEHFQDKGFETSTDKDLVVRGSDHSQFILAGINAIGLSQEGLEGVIHTLEDNLDKIDVKYIEELSNSIVEFVAKHSEKVFVLPEESQFSQSKKETKSLLDVDDEMRVIDEIRLSEEEKLNFNEYKYIKVNDSVILVRRDVEVFTGPYYENKIDTILEGKKLEDFYKIYPEISIVEELGEYKLAQVTIMDGSKDYIENPEIDKVYTIESRLDNINQLEFRFSRDATKNEVQIYQQSIQIIFSVLDTENNIYDNYYDDESSKEIEIDGNLYNTIHREEDNKLNGLCKKVKIKDKNYNIIITSDYGEIWQYETIDETVLAYRELGIGDFIQNIINILSTDNRS